MALFDCQVAALANQATNYLAGGMTPTRLGNAHPNIVPYQVFATLDGHLILAIANDNQFRRFARAAGIEALANDARFATNAERVHHRDVLIALLKPVLARHSTHVWIDRLEAANVPCGPINRIDEVFCDPQAVFRGLAHTVDHAAAGPLRLAASPLRLMKTPPEYKSAPPTLGQHTEEVLSALGVEADELLRLRASGTI